MRAQPTETERPITQGLVSWCAERISDPVLRLKFLRAAAPALQLHQPPAKRRPLRRISLLGYVLPPLLLVPVAVIFIRPNSEARPVPYPKPPAALIEKRAAQVWLVEQNGSSESYSNGLRIDNRFTVSNHPRSYLAFPLAGGPAKPGTVPVGIVFHTTESLQAPFEPDQNRVLKRIGESLVEYVRRRRAYNFLIDRFGRVYRIVRESDAANHAGYSVWADDRWFYVNLNESFLGISFEAETQPGAAESRMTEGQLRAAAMLVEMLRSRYGIAGANCVTHGQVSVNPSNMVAGYHTDWASGFPFQSIGLLDNYSQPLPSIWAFGFQTDASFARNAGPRLVASAAMAEQSLAETAHVAGLSLRAYRKMLRKQYKDRLAELRRGVVEDSE
ncbi:MAG TPA: peptidoglycan recognition family protein [Bryobacteraceae bacterium]|nr:peptidoglycan recognition family protein [Bryobacteraceae bacterium]